MKLYRVSFLTRRTVEARVNDALAAFVKSDLARAWRMENDAEYMRNPYEYVMF